VNETRKTLRKILGGSDRDEITIEDLDQFNIGKSILVTDIWYTVRRQDKEAQKFLLSRADFESRPGENKHWVSFQDIVRNINNGRWGIQLPDENRGRQGWFGRESPRHEGRHDKS
jgi:hypothetical protein